MAGLKLQAVTKSWDGKTQVIKPLTLDVADGEFTIAAQGDAVSASGALQADGGTFDLTTGEGSASVTMSTGVSFGPGGMGEGPGG